MTDDFGEDKEVINGKEWDWKNFDTTKDFPISPQLWDWVIGQEKAITECKLCIDEWVRKLLWLKERQWWKAFEIVERRKEVKLFGHHLFWLKKKDMIFNPKPQAKEYLPSGPFLMLLGDAGTGKSLLGRAMAGYMGEIYKKNGITLYDVCTWHNPVMPSEPRISIHPTPEGATIVAKAYKIESKKGRKMRWFFKGIMALMIGFGMLILSWFTGTTIYNWIQNPLLGWYDPIASAFMTDFLQHHYGNFLSYFMQYIMDPTMIPLFMAGIICLSMGGMLYIFSRIFGGMNGKGSKGIGGAESTKAPKLLIDNSSNEAPFVDATGHGSSQLFGSIAWDPYQTGDLGTPEHQRVTAGDVHRAHLGVLYIDEIKNLYGGEAITLLTVLEDGQLPIALRSHSGISGDTAAMAVATEPVPCMNFLIVAGNMDSVPMIHPALMDRIRGYGKIVYMNNDMENNVVNRRKYIQFMAQEIKRFNLLPFTREACITVIGEARRKSGRSTKLTCKFRPMISVIKTASTLAANEGCKTVEKRHVDEALCVHCKSIQRQVLEREMEKDTLFKIVDPKAKPKVGQIYGMAVTQLQEEDEEMIGSVLPMRASIIRKKVKIPSFEVTGVSATEGSWVQNSISKVRHVFMQKYKKDPATDFISHIDFAQEIGVDGPSAGAAMYLALKSAYTRKRIRQDVAVTGEINISVDGMTIVTPIGGVDAKILAAQNRGFKKVCIPEKNYENNIVPSDYKIKIIPCKTIEDYEREVFVDENSDS
jgi:lon-related putative ATP-dependent protease